MHLVSQCAWHPATSLVVLTAVCSAVRSPVSIAC